MVKLIFDLSSKATHFGLTHAYLNIFFSENTELIEFKFHMEYSGGRCDSLVECLTRDQGVAGSSLTGGTVMCPLAGFIILSLVLVKPRKTLPT